jgi:hypothetical protein
MRKHNRAMHGTSTESSAAIQSFAPVLLDVPPAVDIRGSSVQPPRRGDPEPPSNLATCLLTNPSNFNDEKYPNGAPLGC